MHKSVLRPSYICTHRAMKRHHAQHLHVFAELSDEFRRSTPYSHASIYKVKLLHYFFYSFPALKRCSNVPSPRHYFQEWCSTTLRGSLIVYASTQKWDNAAPIAKPPIQIYLRRILRSLHRCAQVESPKRHLRNGHGDGEIMYLHFTSCED